MVGTIVHLPVFNQCSGFLCVIGGFSCSLVVFDIIKNVLEL